jgi:mannose-6-phosphate isomerase-like protein (cupin superfamily)
MFIKSLSDCPPLLANDGCRVFELLHPRVDAVALPYSLAIAEVDPGESSYRHRLRQTEVYYVLAGRGRMHVGSSVREVGPGDAVVIPGGAVQWIDNLGDSVLRFVALVSPPWRAEDDERLDPDTGSA